MGSTTEKSPLDGAIDVATAALRGGVSTIEAVHTAIARKPFAALHWSPGAAQTADAIRVVHDGITRLVYTCLYTALDAAGGVARVAARRADAKSLNPEPGSLGDLTIAALNGFAGERLAQEGNPLVTPMGLRVDGAMVAPEPAALAAAYPNASPRLALFVHGLACSESMWRLHAERHYGDPHTTYGSRLQRDLGYVPLYVRYNSGLHISENGRQLAQLLDRVVRAWPVPVEEIVVVGHSMGGLVVRSACHYGQQAEAEWVRRARHLFFLGSPHLGAPLEKAVNVAAWALGLIDITRPLADALNARSVGVKDLRYGAVVDEHWKDADLDALLVDRTSDVPLLDGANHYFIAATLTRSARHPLGVAIGDLLVRERSALGRGRVRRLQFPIENGRRFGAMNHFELLNHPDLYDQIYRWLSGPLKSPAPSSSA